MRQMMRRTAAGSEHGVSRPPPPPCTFAGNQARLRRRGNCAAPAPQAAPTPAAPAPVAPAPLTADQVIANADIRRVATLFYAIDEVASVLDAVNAGLQPNPYTFTTQAIVNWLHVSPGDPKFQSTVTAALSLYRRNLALTPQKIYQSNTATGIDPAGNACPPNFAYSRGGVGPVYFCDNFLAKGVKCQRDVMIHEHFHLLGLALPPQPENYGAATPELALKSPDSLAQLAVEISDGPHDASCKGTG